MAASALGTPSGVVDGLYVAEEAGAPMREVREAELLASRGIVGDRYCRRRGTFSVFRVSTRAPGSARLRLARDRTGKEDMSRGNPGNGAILPLS